MMLQCWNENPDSRPYFSDIVLRLQRMLEDSQVKLIEILFSNNVTCTKIKTKITWGVSCHKKYLVAHRCAMEPKSSYDFLFLFSGYEDNKITIEIFETYMNGLFQNEF